MTFNGELPEEWKRFIYEYICMYINLERVDHWTSTKYLMEGTVEEIDLYWIAIKNV